MLYCAHYIYIYIYIHTIYIYIMGTVKQLTNLLLAILKLLVLAKVLVLLENCHLWRETLIK